MDRYLYNLDPYRQASGGYYAPRYPASYALERRSSYADPLSPYARVSIDPYAGYGAAYMPEPLLPPRYVSAPTSPPFRQRPPRLIPSKKGSPPQTLGPRKKPFKQTQKVRFSEGKELHAPKKRSSQPAKKAGKTDVNVAHVSQAVSLAKETKELHSLFRTSLFKTGVDTEQRVKSDGKEGVANGTPKKRKADSQMQKQTPTKDAKNAKKQKGQKQKAAEEKSGIKIEKAERRAPTEEEMREFEAALNLQRGLCKGVSQFLGVPETKEVVADGVEPDGMVEGKREAESESKETEKDNNETEKKPEEPQRTPEEEKEVEGLSFKFFSNLFVEHQELRNLYVDKCNSGSFECLVCHSVDASKSKTFWNVVSLVMHTKMRKKMQPEHAGYGRAVSAVLGWDHENTPKVPRNTRPATVAKKSVDQLKDATKQEAVEKVFNPDLKGTETNGKEDKEGENISECSEDAKEE